ncbi:hypothetical protein CMO86_03425 [Candidatus Woesearchaeota archaeon]|mgnify:CR=1 FL=1|nr:hypothetical protein [Candidatus Woesearchaeota archaeon]|tara:strand:- start:3709 stop:3924 length:216 start_codon:yes stop_codon:yes gene_type:complete
MADYIQYSIDVEYEDHAYGRVETRTETFTTSAPGQVPQDLFARIEQWRYDNGYVIKTELIPSNCTAAQASE